MTAWLLILSLAFSDFIFTNASSVLDYVSETLTVQSDVQEDGESSAEDISIYDDDVLSEDDDILAEESPGGGYLDGSGRYPRSNGE